MQKTVETLYRDVQIRALHENKRTAELSFSSEEPVERWFGIEILDHSPESVRLERLQDGGPLLCDHDTADVIGKVESASIEGGKGRATVRFGNSDRASEIWQDVKDGIRSTVSVGYRVFKAVLEESASEGLDVYRITDWMPIELSLVSVPADSSVGVGRSQEDTNILEIMNMSDEIHVTRSERRRGSADTGKEIDRVQQIRGIGKQCNEQELAEEYIRGGASVELFQQQVLRNMKKPIYASPLPGTADDEFTFLDNGFGRVISQPGIGLTAPEVGQFSFCRAILAQVDPVKYSRQAGFELECSRAMEKEYGIKREGFHVPPEVLSHVMGQRDLSVGTTTAGGHTVATNLLSFIELLRKSSTVRAAGATVMQGLTGNVSIPRHTSAASAFWVAEAASPTESQQAFDQLALSPNTVGAFTDFSRKLMLQSSIDIEAFIRNDLATILAIEIDRVSIEGSGSGAEPLGILGTTGIGDVAGGTNGLAPTHAHMIELESDISIANGLVGNLAYLTNANARGKLKLVLLDSGSGRFLLEGDQMNGYPMLMSNNVPADLSKGTGSNLSAILFGNWADLVIGEWAGLSILVDPFTGGTAGTVRVIALQDIDIGIRHVQSFSAMQDAITT